MSTNQLSKLNFLSTTERRFYKRKKPSHEQNLMNSSDSRLFSVIKGLNTSSSVRKIHHFQFIKTQQSQLRYSQDLSKTHDTQFFQEPQFIKKQLKAKLSLLFKKSNKKWKIMFQNYQLLKNCPNLDAFNTQQNKFFTIITDLVKQNIQEIEKLQKLQKLCKKQPVTQGKKQQKSIKINLQKIKLIKQNQLLRKRCFESTMKSPQIRKSIRRQSNLKQQEDNDQFLQNNKRVDTFFQLDSNIRLKQQIKQLNQKIYEIENENFKLKQNLVSSQDGLHMMRDDRELLVKKVAELKTQNENLCAQVVRLKLQSENALLKMERWRSIIGFQREQILSYQIELDSIKYEYKDLMRKYKNMAKKPINPIPSNNSNLSSNGFFAARQNQQLTLKYNQLFKEQIQSFQKIRSIFHQKQSEITLDKSFRQGQKKNNKQSYKNYLTEKQTIANKNGIKKLSRGYYAYFKPNFFSFVQGYMDFHGIDLINMEQISATFQLDYDFLATVRAILDSKFNDFLDENFHKASSFPNFTYVWLSKYRIQRKQKKIVCIERDLDKSVIPRFFMNLMSEKLNSNWEIITFREFLMQSLTLDELYFYLMARNFIFQGSLLQNIAAVYQQICYISITDGLNMMQKFIPDINYRKRIEQYIKKYIIYIRKRPVIDAHFLLRILLEYYQAKKHQQFTNLNSLTDLLSKNKPSDSFTFQSFMKIFDYNFVYLSIAQKLEIYKKSFSCSRGKITLQTILTVITQEGYLCREVKKIFCNDQILLKKEQIKQQNQLVNLQTYLPQLANFQKMFQKFYKESFQSKKAQFGLYEMEKKFNSVKEFDQTTIFQRIQVIFHFCIISIRKMFFTKKISLTSFLPILQQITEILLRLNKVTCGKKQILTIMTQFKRQNAARRILKFYRKKRNQMHRNFILGIKDEAKEEEEKINNLRNEFSSMIENLKDKFPQKKEEIEQVDDYEEI